MIILTFRAGTFFWPLAFAQARPPRAKIGPQHGPRKVTQGGPKWWGEKGEQMAIYPPKMDLLPLRSKGKYKGGHSVCGSGPKNLLPPKTHFWDRSWASLLAQVGPPDPPSGDEIRPIRPGPLWQEPSAYPLGSRYQPRWF